MANKYARAGGGDWATNATWSTTDGGGADTVAPTTADVALLTATSGAVTVNTTTCVCSAIDMRNYANTLTLTSGQKLSISGGGFSFLAGTIAGTGLLATLTTALTLDYSGATSSSGVLLTSAIATTHVGPGTSAFTWRNITQTAGNTVLGSAVYTVDATLGVVWGSHRLYISRDLSGSAISGSSGTPILVMAGTGTLGASGGLNIGIGFEIDTAGTITFGTDLRFGSSNAIFKYIQGTVDSSAGTVSCFAQYTFNTSGMTFHNMRVSSASLVIQSEFKVTTFTVDANLVMTGAFNLTFGTCIIQAGKGITMVNGTTMTVGALYMSGNGVTNATLVAPVGGSANVNYTGTEDGYRICYGTITRIVFLNRKMYNWFGTNTTVTNCTANTTYQDARLVMPQLVGV